MPRKLRRGGSKGGRGCGLNPRHLTFVRLMVEGRVTPTEAARQVGYKHAKQAASKLLHDPVHRAVQEAIARGREQAWERAVANGAEVLAELSRIARADLRDVVEWGPEGVTLRPSGELAEDAARTVQSVRQTRHGPQVKLHDKLRALEILAKHHGLLAERVQLEGAGGGPLVIRWMDDDPALEELRKMRQEGDREE